MTELSRTILDKYQVRKSKQQKTDFINLISGYMPVEVQSGGLFNSRNIIAGNLKEAKVVFTAHYDTCAVMPVPNFIMPKNLLLSVLYSMVIVIPLFALSAILNALLYIVTDNFWVHYIFSLGLIFGFLWLLMAGKANKHTANDNTSGVITLCEIYSRLTEEQKQKVAIVFFDHEEIGLFGSSLFKKQYKDIMADKLLVNFDCVSDGDNILLAVSKAAQPQYMDKISQAFTAQNKNIMVEKGEKVYYPSDQMHFKKHVAVAALKHNKFVGYYMDRIHTPKDTVFDERNIQLLAEGAVKLSEMIQ